MRQLPSARSEQSHRNPVIRRGEVNLHDLLMVVTVLMGGLTIAVYAGQQFGWIGLLPGLVIGPLLCLAVLYLLVTAFAFVSGLIWDGVPYLPTCGNGKCKSGWLTDFGDYEWETDDENRALFRCRCGLLYWRDREAARVLEVLPDGSTKPYMVWQPFRGWKAERS